MGPRIPRPGRAWGTDGVVSLRRLLSFRAFCAACLVALFGLSLWARVTSLETSPATCADEAFFGLQAERLAHGRAISSTTGSYKPVDYVYSVAGAPLHLIFRPSYALERTPAVLFGLAAVVLCYVFVAREFDRTTGLIAAGLLAVLPIAIMYARIGWEYSEVPFWTALILAFAARGRRLALIVSYLFCLHVSPTAVFLAPVPMCILGARLLPGSPGPRAGRRRPIAVTMATLAAVVIAAGLNARRNQTTQMTFAAYGFGPPNWGQFLRLFKHHLLGFCQYGLRESSTLHDWLFWTPCALVLALGSWQLVRRRRWERLAVVVGWLAALAGYHLVVGPGGFHYLLPRYGLFLTVPTVISVAILAESLLVPPTRPAFVAARRLQVVALIAVGFVLVMSYKLNYFDLYYHWSERPESFWTLATEADEPIRHVATAIGRDLEGAGRAPSTVIVAEDWWCAKPLEYFLARRGGVEVGRLDLIPLESRPDVVARRLRGGGYVLAVAGGPVEAWTRALFPAESLRHWHVQEGRYPRYALYRLRRRPDEPESCDECLARGDRPAASARR
ncbi:MAG TPA: hypothetical protein VG406_00980 [Isosphaeraceae bacterium]|jgi:hypothetical protein|nr:hypothetical protein [Isosphaeraceae bacterium]